MATKKTTTQTKKAAAPKASKVPTAKAVAAAAAAAETKGQPAPVAVKAAVKPTETPATVAAKPAAPVAAKPVAAKPSVISQAERQRMIEQAAYFRAEKHGFDGDSSAHWRAAEADIDADLKRRGIVVR
ncbi:MAG: DUF2934 domain-containing protein [Kiritimatiellae bacterium]|nr:DUF2934 domain-containing protein [Kiritimatiellia bacterium]